MVVVVVCVCVCVCVCVGGVMESKTKWNSGRYIYIYLPCTVVVYPPFAYPELKFLSSS